MANFIAEVEQIAFSPSHLVPGIEPSPDRMLQGRLFAYGDTQRHRIGANYQQIPVNCPYKVSVNNYHKDGPMKFVFNLLFASESNINCIFLKHNRQPKRMPQLLSQLLQWTGNL